MKLSIGKRRLVIPNALLVVGILFTCVCVFQITTTTDFDRYTGDTRQAVYVCGVYVNTNITSTGLAQQMASLGIKSPQRKWVFLGQSTRTLYSRTIACNTSSGYSGTKLLGPVLELYGSEIDPVLKKTFLEAFLLHAQTSDEIDLDIQFDQRRVFLLANGQRVAELPMDSS